MSHLSLLGTKLSEISGPHSKLTTPTHTWQKARSGWCFAASHQCVLCPHHSTLPPALPAPSSCTGNTDFVQPIQTLEQVAVWASQLFRSKLCLIHPSYCKSFPPDGSYPSLDMPTPPLSPRLRGLVPRRGTKLPVLLSSTGAL